MTTILIIIAVCYLLTILYLHHRIMLACSKVEATPDTKRVVGIINDTRPDNLINKDLK